MRKVSTFDLALMSIFGAIIMIMSLIPQLGFVTIFPGVSVTLVHIPVLIGIFVLKRNYAIGLGFLFGLGSFIAAFIYGKDASDLAFRNPLISIAPRMLFALVAYYVLQGFKKLEKVKHGHIAIFFTVSFVSLIAIFYGSNALGNQITNITDTAKNIIRFVALLIFSIFMTFYYSLLKKNKFKNTYTAATFVLSTIAHTVLVLTAMLIIQPGELYDTFGGAVKIIYTIASANGLIEALMAVLIGTPLVYALSKIERSDADDSAV